MQMIAGVAVPFFAVLLCGFLARRLGVLDPGGVRGLNAFVYWFALPALLFWKVSATPFERLADPSFYIVYVGAELILYGTVFLVLRLAMRRTQGESAIAALGATWGNVGYMGVPLLVAAYRPDQALPAVLATALDAMIMQTLTIALIEASAEQRRGGLGPLGVLRALLTNPLVLSVLLGFVVAAFGLRLPVPLEGFLAILGPAAGPGALFALGATLQGNQLVGRAYALVAGLTVTRLLALPVLAFLVMRVVPLPADLVEPTLVTTALPTAASVFVLAQRYRILEQPIAILVFVTHLLGIATLTGLLVLMSHH